MFFSPTSWEAPLVSSVSELTTSPRLEIMLEDAFYQVKPSEPQWPEWPQNGKGISQQAVVTGFFCGNSSLKAHIYIYMCIHIYIYTYIYIYTVYIYIEFYSICISTRLRHFWSQTAFSFRKSWGRRGSESRRKARTRRAEFLQFPHEMAVFKRGNFHGGGHAPWAPYCRRPELCMCKCPMSVPNLPITAGREGTDRKQSTNEKQDLSGFHQHQIHQNFPIIRVLGRAL